jgi:hypothetical protein
VSSGYAPGLIGDRTHDRPHRQGAQTPKAIPATDLLDTTDRHACQVRQQNLKTMITIARPK